MPLKAQSLTLLLSHYETGRYREIRAWHNDVHRVELQAMVPHIYHSEDLVAPPEYMDARAFTELKWRGGECLSLYWSEGSLEALTEDNRKASQDRRNAGSYHPFQDVVWAARMRAHDAYPRAALGYDVNAAPFAPNTGLVLVVEQIVDPARQAEYAAWLEQDRKSTRLNSSH